MKKIYIISLLLFSITLAWCNYNKDTNPSVDTWYNSTKENTQLTWKIALWKIISDWIHEIVISWNQIKYDNTFSIEIPKDLDIWKYWKKKRLDFITDSSQKYIHIDSYTIPDWKANKSDKEKCILGNYESHILSSSTISKVVNDQTVYITKAVRSTDHERNDLDLCFVKNSIIYTVSVSAYEPKESEYIINSFKFIE